MISKEKARPAGDGPQSFNQREIAGKTVAAVVKWARRAGVTRATAIRLVERGLNAQESDRKIHELAEAVSLLAAAINEIRKGQAVNIEAINAPLDHSWMLNRSITESRS